MRRPRHEGTLVEDKPLPAFETATLKELPMYWRLITRSRTVTRETWVARMKALVLLSEGLDRRVALLADRCKRLNAENDLLVDELRRKRREVLSYEFERKKLLGQRLSEVDIEVQRQAMRRADQELTRRIAAVQKGLDP